MSEGGRAVGGAGAAHVRGTTRVVGVIGWPVEHSLSPAIHNAAFAALGLDWVYVPLPVPPDGIAAALAGLSALRLAGANVTMPHKTEVARLLGRTSSDAERLRAVNTIVVRPDGVEGHNTDAPGFERFLREDAGFDVAGRTALLLGAGGAARAVALAMARQGLGRLIVALREPGRADEVRATLEGFDTDVAAVPFEDAAEADVEIVVNATPLGGRGERLPTPTVGPGALVVDLLTRPAATPLVEDARAVGASAFGGLGLLLHQAALSFELWTGRVPPIDVMSAAAVGRLGRGSG